MLIIHGLLLPALVKVSVLKAAGQKRRRVGEGDGGGWGGFHVPFEFRAERTQHI